MCYYRGLVEEEEAEERRRCRVSRRQRRHQGDGVGHVVAPKQALGVPRPLPLLLRGAVVEPERADVPPFSPPLCYLADHQQDLKDGRLQEQAGAARTAMTVICGTLPSTQGLPVPYPFCEPGAAWMSIITPMPCAAPHRIAASTYLPCSDAPFRPYKTSLGSSAVN